MLYMSNDKKRVFKTEQECCEYEHWLEQERIKNEKFEAEKKDKLRLINRKYNELQNLIYEFEKDYSVRNKPYFAPAYELMDILCG